MLENQIEPSVVESYIAQTAQLFVTEADDARESLRSGSMAVPQVVAERVGALEESSAELDAALQAQLDSNILSVRESAEFKLLHQSNVETEIARQLFELADAVNDGEVADDEPMRSGHSLRFVESVNELEMALRSPLGAGLESLIDASPLRSQRPVANRDSAKAACKDATELTLDGIAKQSAETAGKALQALVLMDAEQLSKGVALISEDAAAVIARVSEGAKAIATRLAKAAVRFVLRVFNRLVALLGENVANAARKQVQGWVDELKDGSSDDGDTLFSNLVGKLYGIEQITAEVDAWLEDSEVSAEKLTATAAQITAIEARFDKKMQLVGGILKLLSWGKNVTLFKTPQGALLLAGVMVTLVGYTVYSACDHCDTKQIAGGHKLSFALPDRVVGVREVARIGLT